MDPPGQTRSPYTLTTYLVPGSPGSLVVTPGHQTTVPGQPVSAQVSWSGLTAGSYLGYLAYAGPRLAPRGTLVEVEVG